MNVRLLAWSSFRAFMSIFTPMLCSGAAHVSCLSRETWKHSAGWGQRLLLEQNRWLHTIPIHIVPVSVTLSFGCSWTFLDKLSFRKMVGCLWNLWDEQTHRLCLLCLLLLGPSFLHTKGLCCPVTSSDHVSDTKHSQILGSGVSIFRVDWNVSTDLSGCLIMLSPGMAFNKYGTFLGSEMGRKVGSARQLIENCGFEFQFAEYLFKFQVRSVRNYYLYCLKKSLGIQQEIMMSAQKREEAWTMNLGFRCSFIEMFNYFLLWLSSSGHEKLWTSPLAWLHGLPQEA